MKTTLLPFLIVILFSKIAFSQPQIVSYTTLEQFLPQQNYGNYVRGKPTGETSSMMGFYTSWAAVTYDLSTDSTKAQISVKLTDMLNLPSFSRTLPQINKETPGGYERTVKYKSFEILEACDTTTHQQKLQFPFAGRFLIEVSGQGVQDISQLHGILDMIDLPGLKKLTR